MPVLPREAPAGRLGSPRVAWGCLWGTPPSERESSATFKWWFMD